MDNYFYSEVNFLIKDIKNVIGVDSLLDKSGNSILISINSSSLTFLMDFLYSKYRYKYLTVLTCNNINEEEQFELMYVLNSSRISVTAVISTKILKRYPVYTTIAMIHPIANYFEIEIFKKYGISFEGNKNTTEFSKLIYDKLEGIEDD